MPDQIRQMKYKVNERNIRYKKNRTPEPEYIKYRMKENKQMMIGSWLLQIEILNEQNFPEKKL